MGGGEAGEWIPGIHSLLRPGGNLCKLAVVPADQRSGSFLSFRAHHFCPGLWGVSHTLVTSLRILPHPRWWRAHSFTQNYLRWLSHLFSAGILTLPESLLPDIYIICSLTSFLIRRTFQDFPGGPVAKTLCSQCRGPGSIPGQGTRAHMLQLKDPEDLACCK